ncbi:serine-type D-Ala-D-Ala carboxypeptidase/endopeptidase (penicillin-binding protein 4) [Burkholderiales bacterium]|nr:serine-type D-Ala-D-Ala carboxypeptidase/endopeptidase (penicillin-binding protein 4) [Burkholderiales bacterium]
MRERSATTGAGEDVNNPAGPPGRRARAAGSRPRMRRIASVAALVAALAPLAASSAALPREIARAFLDRGVPLTDVAIVVQEAGAFRPLFSLQAQRPMNPASVMKLVTTFAALELLGRDYRWRTEAYVDGAISEGVLDGDLVLKGGGDPKITVEQWSSFMAALRERGLAQVNGDLVLDRSYFRPPPHDPGAFDGEPLTAYNVGPDALLVNFNVVRFRFQPSPDGAAVDVRPEPPLPQLALGSAPMPVDGPCGDWRTSVSAAFVAQPRAAAAAFPGLYPRECGERDWNIALLDVPNYVHGMFSAAFAAAGGSFDGVVREGRAPEGVAPFAVLESVPLHEVVRDINKLSNNVMARQLFLTLATTTSPPPATVDKARDAVRRWLAKRKLVLPGFVIENGSGLSRNERLSAAGIARLLAAADASDVREEFASSLAVAAIDGTVQRRFRDGTVAGQALLKTGSLEGVRALGGYVIDNGGRRWIVAAIVNHPNAARAQSALDLLVQWTHRHAAGYYVPSTR